MANKEQGNSENRRATPKLFEPIEIGTPVEGFSIYRSNGNGVYIGNYPNAYITLFVEEWDRKGKDFVATIRASIPLLNLRTETNYNLQAGKAYKINNTSCEFNTKLIEYKRLNLICFTFRVPPQVNVLRSEIIGRAKSQGNIRRSER